VLSSSDEVIFIDIARRLDTIKYNCFSKVKSLLMPRIRMSGAVTLLPLCAFKAWSGTTLALGS
jgi:hypothetical protein